MLLRLLALLGNADNSITSTQEIARRLETSEGLVSQMLEDAVRMGYLALGEQGCAASTCAGCHHRAGCAASNRPTLWSLTEKGRRLLSRP